MSMLPRLIGADRLLRLHVGPGVFGTYDGDTTEFVVDSDESDLGFGLYLLRCEVTDADLDGAANVELRVGQMVTYIEGETYPTGQPSPTAIVADGYQEGMDLPHTSDIIVNTCVDVLLVTFGIFDIDTGAPYDGPANPTATVHVHITRR